MARPEDVIFPRARVSDVKPIYSTGDNGWSVATLVYDDNPTVGIRWNGNASEAGYPNGRTGHPVWFILPEPLHMPVITSVTFFAKFDAMRKRIAAEVESTFG